ncbi:MAG: tyrosine-type recombinase/integrase [Nitrospirae bacterium]|nr:tyrosine-type recombinase/integrase [Nitrospirota bacterium]
MALYKHRQKWMYDFVKLGVRFRKGGFRTEEDAKIAEAEARKKIKGINTTFLKLMQSRLEELETRRTDSWFQENKRLLDKVNELWGQKKEITRQDVESFLNKVAEGFYENPQRKKRETKRYQYANSCLKMIRALFRHGIEREIWNDDPTERIKKFPVSKKRKYIPSIDDIKAVLSAAKPMDRLYLLIVIHTLGRISAVNHLKWEDVFPDYLLLKTRKARNSDLKEIRIPMNAVLRETLEQIPQGGEFVFMNKKTDKPYVYRSKLLKTVCENAGVKPFSFHAFRHFGASYLDSKGTPLTTIQQLLGHERATTTDYYLQSIRGSISDAIKLLEDLK